MMPEPQPLTVDFTKENDVLQILPLPAQRSSEHLEWQNIYIQQHHQPAWETPESAHIKHMILVHRDLVATQAERWFDGRREREQIEGENNVIIVPANVLHKANWNRDSTFSLLFLEPDLLERVAYESVKANRIRLIPQRTMSDPTIDRIARLLSAELETNMFGSSLFANSLTIALAVHLLRHYTDLQQPLRTDLAGLSRQKLQQAIDYINDHLTENLTVTAIADELQMSQYYFSRLFKQAVGVSPYQYAIGQRIERAKLLLQTTSLSIAQIAERVGFANQNQLTIQFRKFVGTTPTAYRSHL